MVCIEVRYILDNELCNVIGLSEQLYVQGLVQLSNTLCILHSHLLCIESVSVLKMKTPK